MTLVRSVLLGSAVFSFMSNFDIMSIGSRSVLSMFANSSRFTRWRCRCSVSIFKRIVEANSERAPFGRMSHSQLNAAILLNMVFSSGAGIPSRYGRKNLFLKCTPKPSFKINKCALNLVAILYIGLSRIELVIFFSQSQQFLYFRPMRLFVYFLWRPFHKWTL